MLWDQCVIQYVMHENDRMPIDSIPSKDETQGSTILMIIHEKYGQYNFFCSMHVTGVSSFISGFTVEFHRQCHACVYNHYNDAHTVQAGNLNDCGKKTHVCMQWSCP